MSPSRYAVQLIQWWEMHKRSLPWKQSSDPYRVWVSEIILQQTRVRQGIKYYNAFLEVFPNVESLALASEEKVLKAWEGLGYYNRVRNMHTTAKFIMQHYHGQFPEKYDDIIRLKGIGPYTAAAIASFSFGLPYPVVDGNVLRIITRILGIERDISQKSTMDEVKTFTEEAIQHAEPADFNQAMMDFGSLVCVPFNPACDRCVLQEYCQAYKQGKTADIPLKKKKPPIKNRFFHYFDIDLPQNKTIIMQRPAGDIWPRLFELPVLETEDAECPSVNQILERLFQLTGNKMNEGFSLEKEGKSQQVLSHQRIHGFFYKLTLNHLNISKNTDLYLVEREKVSNFAFPKILKTYIGQSRDMKADIRTNANDRNEIKLQK